MILLCKYHDIVMTPQNAGTPKAFKVWSRNMYGKLFKILSRTSGLHMWYNFASSQVLEDWNKIFPAELFKCFCIRLHHGDLFKLRAVFARVSNVALGPLDCKVLLEVS